MRSVLLLVAGAALTTAAGFPNLVCDVTAHGAGADSKRNDAASMQKAINAAAHAGDGVVHFLAGNYLSGTVALKSNVTLRLAPGATL